MLVKLPNNETKEILTLWMEGSDVKMINQKLLPYKFEIYTAKTYQDTAKAIKNMTVRGAGAIGVAGAYGIAQACLTAPKKDINSFLKHVKKAEKTLKNTRPTAVNLFHDIDRVLAKLNISLPPEKNEKIMIEEAKKIAEESIISGKKIGENGESLIKNGAKIMTHCNAGALAFVDWGSALAPIRLAHRNKKSIIVYVNETRPRSQGAKLTSWELLQEDIPHIIIPDTAAGYYISRKEIDLIIIGADRIAANGDTANKIGTYTLAILAKENNIPFYVAAPLSTFDLKTTNGKAIPIEQRSETEITHIWGLLEKNKKIEKIRITPKNSPAKNPAFDITPAKYITTFITEKTLINPPFEKTIKETLKN